MATMPNGMTTGGGEVQEFEDDAMPCTLPERLRRVACDREPFTPDHAECICRLANAAADEIECQHQYRQSLKKHMAWLSLFAVDDPDVQAKNWRDNMLRIRTQVDRMRREFNL